MTKQDWWELQQLACWKDLPKPKTPCLNTEELLKKNPSKSFFCWPIEFQTYNKQCKKKNISSNWSVGIFSGWTHRVRNQWYTRSISIPFIPLLKGGFLDILYGNNWTLGRKKAAKNLVGLLVKTSHFRCRMILESSSSGFQPTNQPTNRRTVWLF